MTDCVRMRLMGSIAASVCLCVGVGVGVGISEAGTSSANNPTYTEDVAPILMASCVTCHRPGQVAPMSLMTYTETRPWARSIRNEVSQRRMPPWHAEPGVREYTNDRSLSDAKIDVILRWVDAAHRRAMTNTCRQCPVSTTTGNWASQTSCSR